MSYVQIAGKKKRRKRKGLTAAQKSELCQQCGRCCMAMTFEGGPVDEDALDQIRWMELHGMRIDYFKRGRSTIYYYTMPTACSQLRESGGRYSCGIYDTRPQMCRDYEGWATGPEGVAECLWFEPDE